MKASKAQIKTINRLSAQAVFDSLRQTKDVRWVATGLIVQVQPRPADLPGAYGLCVSASKKTAPRAVDRNRIRRGVFPRMGEADLDFGDAVQFCEFRGGS